LTIKEEIALETVRSVNEPLSVVFNEDCMEGMKRYPDKYFDLAIVDPPYGLGDEKLTNGGTWAAKYKKGDCDFFCDSYPERKHLVYYPF